MVHRHPDNLTKPGAPADTSIAKLAGYAAILDGALGISVDPGQRRQIENFVDRRIALLRYQSSLLGLNSYVRYAKLIPGRPKQHLVTHMLSDPKSTVRSLVYLFCRPPNHTHE